MNHYQLQQVIDGELKAALTVVASNDDQARLALLRFAASLPVTGASIKEYVLKLANGNGEIIFKLVITGSDDEAEARGSVSHWPE